MGSAQSTHSATEINNAPQKQEVVNKSAVSGQKTSVAAVPKVVLAEEQPNLISTNQEEDVDVSSDEEADVYESEEEYDSDDEGTSIRDPRLLVC